MKQLSAFLFLLLPFALFAQQNDAAFTTADNGDEYLSTIINLKVKPEYRNSCTSNSISIPTLVELFETLGATLVEKKFPTTKPPTTQFNSKGKALADLSLIYKVTVPFGTDIIAQAEKFAQLPYFQYAEPHFVSSSHYVPNDGQLNSVMPYHYDNINAYEAWDITLGDTNVVIGITETAIYNLHPDFVGNIKYNYDDPPGNSIDDDSDNYTDNYAGWDMVDNDNDPFRNGEIHGDAVAGIASATADNTIGFAGIGFKCKFLPVKVANDNPTITHGYEGITYCVEQGCSIVNCSWGNKTFSQVAQDVVTWAAVNNDVVLVASAGNENSEDMYYPASYEHVLSVTGVDDSDIFEDGANTFSRNDSVDVSAPGIDIYTTAYLGGTVFYSPPQGGTSMAAPIVSGIAGLVRSQFPCFNAAQVIEKIKASADPIGGLALNVPYAGLIGTGRVNAEAAVTGIPCDPVGITETTESASLTVYPNPASREINIRMSRSADWKICIYDTQARVIYNQAVKSDRAVISNLASGFYVLRVSNDVNTFSRRVSIIRD